MNNRNDETAFFVQVGQTDEKHWGMSLHDWFMGQAIQGAFGATYGTEFVEAVEATDNEVTF